MPYLGLEGKKIKNLFKPQKTVNTISLSRQERLYLIGLRFERYFSHHRVTQMIMSRIFEGTKRTWTETIKLSDKKKFRNVTNCVN